MGSTVAPDLEITTKRVFLRFKKEGKPLTIYGDGQYERAYSYVTDVVDATIKAFLSDKLKGGEVLNIGSPKSYTVNYLADLVGGEKVYLPPRPGDPRKTQADITLALELLLWEPKVSLEEGVELVKQSFSLLEAF